MTTILNTTTLTFLQETTFIFYTIAFGWINVTFVDRLLMSWLNLRALRFISMTGQMSRLGKGTVLYIYIAASSLLNRFIFHPLANLLIPTPTRLIGEAYALHVYA